MQIIAKKRLRAFWDEHPRARRPLEAWHRIVDRASWAGPADIKVTFGNSVDFVGDNRVIFDLGGNKYRLVVHVAYLYGIVLVKFIGTHAQYDQIDPETVR